MWCVIKILIIFKKLQMKFVLLLFIILYFIFLFRKNIESFRNILPTFVIDPEYVNINDNPHNYKNHMTVGDIMGVDLNCNNITTMDLLKLINDNHHALHNRRLHHNILVSPSTALHEFVYKYDPSINIYNPNHTPRVLKMLLRNLPELHPIIQKCLHKQVRL